MRTIATRRALQLALLGSLFAACSGNPAHAGESESAKELRAAREALGRWAELEADQFEKAARRTLAATEARIAELREQVAGSELADDAKEVLADLEQRRQQLATQLAELKGAAADRVDDARKAIVDGATEFAGRLEKAWAVLAGG